MTAWTHALVAAGLCATLTAAEDGEAKPTKHKRWRHTPRAFAMTVQGNVPLKDLKTALDGRTGLGLGATWTRDHSETHASRTRLEWNTFSQGSPVAGVRTEASNYTFTLDHLWRIKGSGGVYLMGGLGAVRWFTTQEVPGLRASSHTTKLTVQAGLGWQFCSVAGAEVRYAVSSIDNRTDANMVQAALSFRF